MPPFAPPGGIHENASVRRFLVVGMQRSGTTVTRSLLASHPDIALGPEEIHLAFFQRTVVAATDRGETPQHRSATLRGVFDALAGRRADHAFVGLKTALTDAAATARLVACLAAHAHDVDLVVVRRHDLLAQLASLRRAQATGIWHDHGGGGRGAEVKVTITPAELAAYVADCVACERLLATLAAGRRVLHIDYEADIVGGQLVPVLQSFFGIALAAADRADRALRKVSPPLADYLVDAERLAALVPGLRAAALATPLPAPEATDVESRLFLLYRAQWLLRRSAGREAARDAARDAVHDALAAIDAPPDWGVTSQQWAADTLADALPRAGDAALVREVVQRLDRHLAHADDRHLRGLRRRLALS
jgi:LPS sulfotransferase NodH